MFLEIQKNASPCRCLGTRFVSLPDPADRIPGVSVLMRLDVDEFTTFLTGGEYHHAINESEQSVILAHTYIETGMMLGATLTLQDIAGLAVRPTEDFNTKSFAF